MAAHPEVREHRAAALPAEQREAADGRVLGEGQQPVAEVAYLTGFSGPSAFHRAFRGAYGVTPGTWRATGGGSA